MALLRDHRRQGTNGDAQSEVRGLPDHHPQSIPRHADFGPLGLGVDQRAVARGPVYATEGTPVIGGRNDIFKQAPNPTAARLFQSFCFTPEAQQLIIDHGGMRSEHLQTKEKPGRKPFREIKVMKEDAAAGEKMSEEIKARYTKIFGV